MFKASSVIFVSLFLLSCKSADVQNPDIQPTNDSNWQKIDDSGTSSYYRTRYALKKATDKLVNDTGNGFEPLYGVRNFRAVLNGIYYRGGANNMYNKHGKRSNMNPLPNEGLENLCQEGFSQAIYLYPTNYKTAPNAVSCNANKDGSAVRIEYLLLSSLSDDREVIHRILTLVHDHIMHPDKGPIYAHCWNGWHASGFAAASALRQFCGFNGEQAVNYWNINTDGAYKGYDSIRQRIRDFVPYPELTISDDMRKSICPDPNTLEFAMN